MNKKTQETMFSSKNDEWSTPQELYDILDSIFQFTLDPCSTNTNKKCKKWYTKEDDGLSKNWSDETVFCNPPYSRKTKSNPGQQAWIEKCHEEYVLHNTTSVLLIPARTDTEAMHEHIFADAKYLCFVKGRIKFGDNTSPAPFPSMIAVFTSADYNEAIYNFGESLGYWIKLGHNRQLGDTEGLIC